MKTGAFTKRPMVGRHGKKSFTLTAIRDALIWRSIRRIHKCFTRQCGNFAVNLTSSHQEGPEAPSIRASMEAKHGAKLAKAFPPGIWVELRSRLLLPKAMSCMQRLKRRKQPFIDQTTRGQIGRR